MTKIFSPKHFSDMLHKEQWVTLDQVWVLPNPSYLRVKELSNHPDPRHLL